MKAELKNLYESIIQDMIVDGIDGMTPEIKKLIQKAPVEKRRSMILTILEENNVEHRLLCNKIQKTIEVDNYSEMNHIKDVVGMLREYVKVSKTEVKTMGEVMTPITLVEEMLDTLPYEVWTNPNLKWLDPCNGVGTFFSVVIERLMKGLESFEPNEKLRYKHIIENMIYACELQPKNLFLYLYAFDPKDEYSMNVYCGSYLDDGFDKHMETWDYWGIEKFDVIVMNPPYQELKEGNKKSQALWDKFVIKTISQLVDGGYLVAVHPSGWRNVDGMFKVVQNILKEKQLLYLEFHNEKDGLKTFGAETRYDFYCLHNVQNTMFTKIKCQDGTIERANISKMEFIPNGMFKEIQLLLAKDGEERVEILHSFSDYETRKPHVSKEQTEEFKYPIIYTVPKGDVPKLMYSNTDNNGHFNIPKFIWSNGRIISVGSFVDNKGFYGLTQFAFAIVDEEHILNRIKEAFDTKNFRNLMENCAISDMSINRKAISLFRKDFWKEYL
ncbi:Eco57I restriction-modification methylase domain-containing protein, partial [Candidatus Dojkabacteria bacterium]|nr:Eco57I restriction-modification methylase domain-containing protein [Candidatus Dojkabacteria bacterium]